MTCNQNAQNQFYALDHHQSTGEKGHLPHDYEK